MDRTHSILAALMSLSLTGCAILVVPAAATAIEASRDRKGDFEKSRNALLGKSILVECRAEPFEHRMFRGCGIYRRENRLNEGAEFVFEIAPPPCAYAIIVGIDNETVVGWRYVSAPEACWQFYLQ